MLRLLYPERRQIEEREVIAWARDILTDEAIAKRAKDLEMEGDRQITDEEIDRIALFAPVPDLQEAIEILEDAGKATFSKR